MAPGTSRTFPNVQIKKKRHWERLERFPTLAIFFNFSYQKRETNSNSNYSNYSNSSSLRIIQILRVFEFFKFFEFFELSVIQIKAKFYSNYRFLNLIRSLFEVD